MREGKQQIYWDACIFIHYIEGTKRWMPTLDAILEEASERRTVEIYTSTVSITEVAFAQAERVGRALDSATEAAIDALWADREVIRLVEFNEVIARGARDLLRQAVAANRRLKPMDAIHLATAQRRRVDDFHTTDEPLQRDWQDLGFPVRDPYTLQPRLIPPTL